MTNLSTGENVGNGGGQALVDDTTTIQAKLNTTYIDVRLAPTAGHDVALDTVQTSDLLLNSAAGTFATPLGPTRLPGTDVFRFYLTGNFNSGEAVATLMPGSWSDTGGTSGPGGGRFTVVPTRAEVIAPFGAGDAIDVDVANGDRDTTFTPGTMGDDPFYVDVEYRLPSGALLDYDTILDDAQEFTISGTGILGTPTLAGQPLPIELVADPETGLLTARIVAVTRGSGATNGIDDDGDGAVDEAGELSAEDLGKLRTAGVTRFRYRFEPAMTGYTTGAVTFTWVAGGWADTQGNTTTQDARTLTVLGPTATLANPSAGSGIDRDVFNDRNWIDVTYAADATDASISDLAPEFTLSGDGLGTVSIDASQRPTRLPGTANTWRYWLTGVFAATGDVDVTPIAGSVTFGGAGTMPAAAVLSNPGTTNDRTYVDVRFDPTARGALDENSILDDGDELSIPGLTPLTSGGVEVLRIAEGVYRYTSPARSPPAITTRRWPPAASRPRRRTTPATRRSRPSGCSGRPRRSSDPATQSTTGARNLNDRGYVDVGITAPAGRTLDVDSVLDFGGMVADEIALTGPGAAGLALDRSQAPLFLRRQGNTWFFRFWTRGSYASRPADGSTYVAGTFGFLEGGDDRRRRRPPRRSTSSSAASRRRTCPTSTSRSRRPPPTELNLAYDPRRRAGVHLRRHRRRDGRAARGRRPDPARLRRLALLPDRRLRAGRRRRHVRCGLVQRRHRRGRDERRRRQPRRDTQTFTIGTLTAGTRRPGRRRCDRHRRRSTSAATSTSPTRCPPTPPASTSRRSPTSRPSSRSRPPGVDARRRRARRCSSTATRRGHLDVPLLLHRPERRRDRLPVHRRLGRLHRRRGRARAAVRAAPRHGRRGDGSDASATCCIDVPFGELAEPRRASTRGRHHAPRTPTASTLTLGAPVESDGRRGPVPLRDHGTAVTVCRRRRGRRRLHRRLHLRRRSSAWC